MSAPSVRALGGLAAVTLVASCSLVLDFDDVEGLPCDCLPGYVCLSTSQTCVAAGSVDDFKSCDIFATPNPDDQCRPGRDCVDLRGRGPQCLPRCNPLIPFVSDVGREIATQCGDGKYCWEFTAGRGYCDDGECNDVPNTCPPPQECVRINGAGVCFTPCEIFRDDIPCGPTATHCQPVAETRVTACLPSGARLSGENCGLADGACAPRDDQGRAMICTTPLGSSSPFRQCAPRCDPANGDDVCFLQGEGCFTAITNLDSLGTDLGICQEG